MSKVQLLRDFVNQRLTAAAEEICELFERTIAEYEEELEFRSKENHRQLKLLDAADCNPKVRLHRAASSRLYSPMRGPLPVLPSNVRPHRVPPPTLSTNAWSAGPYQPLMSVTPPMLSQYSASTSSCLSVLPSRSVAVMDNEQDMGPTTHRSYKDVQQLLVVEDDVPPEPQEWSSSLDQEEPDPPPHIKEEQEELWTSQEGEQLQGLEETDIKFPLTSVPVKSEEDDEEKAQSSQLHESQTEENREAERTGADGEDCGGPEPARNSDLDSPLQPATHDKTADSSEYETDDSGDWEETREPQSGLNSLQNNVEPGSDVELLKKRTGVQTGGKPFCCSVCGKRFFLKKTLTSHMRLHTEGNHFTCPVCKLVSSNRSTLVKHMRIHTGEKPFTCSLCSKQFAQKGHLRRHLTVHTDVQQLSVVKDWVPPEQQEWSSSLDKEDPEPPHIKEELEELWSSEEGEQLQGLEEADIKFPFTSVPVKSEEDDEEKAQSSQLHESQTEENREAERTGADGQDWGGPEPARNSDPDSPATHDKTSGSSETDDSGDWEETREPQSGLNPLQNNEEPGSNVECNTGKTSVSSSGCAGHEEHLQKPTGVQTGVKPFSCSVCGKSYTLKSSLKSHMRLHSEGKVFTCSICRTSFCETGSLISHMRIHTGEKPFSCSVCGIRFAQKGNLKQHLTVHTGEKSFSCSVCNKRFARRSTLRRHLTVHTGGETMATFTCT
ncbi:gastrula zinc finger protein 5-1-like isoform X1 [Perca flavescens]|uniref:gastrula zinc finger protein 5-1-like isoform X1 n=1 Tax=Perca flavescens TaxID=8167 RepID=UPI00106E2FDF|nr:gastrula zinc finger protein 5-1-like isoform X1 [Perca flavescens]